jgi:hypothetical protein
MSGPLYAEPLGKKCTFHLTGPRVLPVECYLSQDYFTIETAGFQKVVYGCAHSTNNFNSENIYAGVISLDDRMLSPLVMHSIL